MTYPLGFGLALGTADLVLAAQCVDATGANVGDEILTGFVGIGNGYYLWQADIPAGQRGGVKFYVRGTPSVILGFSAINPEEAEAVTVVDTVVDAIKTKTDTLGALSVTIVAPVATHGTGIALVRGDDYLAVDGRALTFTGSNWPVLTAGAVALRVERTAGAMLAYAGVIVGVATCYVELTATQTAALPPGPHKYDLEAILSNSSVVTLVQGVLTVAADVR